MASRRIKLLAHLLGGIIRREDTISECIWPRGTIMMSRSWHWMTSGWTIRLCRKHFDVMRTVAKRPIELLKQWTACIWAFYSMFLFYDFPSKIKVQDTYFIIFKRVDWDLDSKNFWVVWEKWAEERKSEKHNSNSTFHNILKAHEVLLCLWLWWVNLYLNWWLELSKV